MFFSITLCSASFAEDYDSTSSYNNYPMVTKIEQNIFHKSYDNEDIYERLSRLEQSIYHQTYENDALADRVDRLSKHANISDFPAFLVGDIERLERQHLSKTYSNESPEQRLERVEYQLLGATQSGDYEDRIENLKALAQRNSIDDYFASNPSSIPTSSFAIPTQRSYSSNSYSSSSYGSPYQSPYDTYSNDSYNSGPTKGELIRNTLIMLLPIVLGFL